MLLSGNSNIAPGSNRVDLSNVEYILDQERDRTQNEPWNRLDKNIKVQKLLGYADTVAVRQGLSKSDKANLRSQLIGYLDKKLLQRNKDVTYDREQGIVSDVPSLEYSTGTRRFTLRRGNKSSSSQRAVPNGKTRKRSDKIDTGNKD